MPRKGHSPEQVLIKLRQVEVAVAGGKSVGQAEFAGALLIGCGRATSPDAARRVRDGDRHDNSLKAFVEKSRFLAPVGTPFHS